MFGGNSIVFLIHHLQTMVINHLLAGMILQVGGGFKYMLYSHPDP